MECIPKFLCVPFVKKLIYLYLVGAKISHVKKYMDSYAKLYPHASQILVMFPQSFFWTGRKGKVSPHCLPRRKYFCWYDWRRKHLCIPSSIFWGNRECFKYLPPAFSSMYSQMVSLMRPVISPSYIRFGIGFRWSVSDDGTLADVAVFRWNTRRRCCHRYRLRFSSR